MPRSPRPGALARLACHGQCRPDPARRAHHDHLLRVETDADAVVQLMELAVTWSELEYPDGELIVPSGWLDFAQRHRWQDPDWVLRIFSLAVDVALRAAPGVRVSGPGALGMAAGSAICPALVPDDRRFGAESGQIWPRTRRSGDQRVVSSAAGRSPGTGRGAAPWRAPRPP